MKIRKLIFLSLSTFLFVGMMFYNLQHENLPKEQYSADITMLSLTAMPTTAQAESCVYWDEGTIVVSCGSYWGCCHRCEWTGMGNINYCYWTGNPNDACEVDFTGEC